MTGFHDIIFPLSIALDSQYDYSFNTIITELASGKEQRQQKWSSSKRRYNIGTGIKRQEDIARIVDFFHARNGPLNGFLWYDRLFNSTSKNNNISSTDQYIAMGNGKKKEYQLFVTNNIDGHVVYKKVLKPVYSSLLVSFNNTKIAKNKYSLSDDGKLIFNTAPGNNVNISCGFNYHIPVRFEADILSINFSHFQAGHSPSIPLIELL